MLRQSRMPYPFPRIDDSLDALSGERFSNLDLVSGHLQAQILDADRPKTAFSCHKGLHQLKVLPLAILMHQLCLTDLRN